MLAHSPSISTLIVLLEIEKTQKANSLSNYRDIDKSIDFECLRILNGKKINERTIGRRRNVER